MDNDLYCIDCGQEFNLQDKLPYILPNCGHSVCARCMSQSKSSTQRITCKEDNIESSLQSDLIQNKSIMTALMKRRTSGRARTLISPESLKQFQVETNNEFIEEAHGLSASHSTEHLLKGPICNVHQKQIELICMDDGEQICSSCGLFGAHRNHHMKPIIEWVSEMEKVFNEITTTYAEVKQQYTDSLKEQFRKEIKERLINNKQIAIQNLRAQFYELKQAINNLEQQVGKELDNIFGRKEEYALQKSVEALMGVQRFSEQWLNQACQKLKEFANAITNLESVHIKKDEQNIQRVQEMVQEFESEHQQQEKDNINILKLSQLQSYLSICSSGRDIQKKFNSANSTIKDILMSLQQDVQIKLPVELFVINVRQEIMTKLKEEEQIDFSLAGLIEDQKLLASDMLISQSIIHQTEAFEQSSLPTQPSPSYNFQQKIENNYFQSIPSPTQTTQLNQSVMNRQLRSKTQIQEQDDLQSTTSLASSRKKQPLKKWTKDPKMNEKISNILSQIHLDSTEIIDMSLVDFSNELASLLAEYLKGKKSIKVLKLNKCKITDEQFSILFTCFDQNNITTLHLQSNNLSDKTLDFLVKLYNDNKIKVNLSSLYLNCNQISMAKIKRKLDALKKFGLTIQI
ncbi:hypothetical protein pb186bvf_012140 [Paramecium bursaria]